MYYIVDCNYSVVEEKDNIVFWNIESDSLKAIFHIDKAGEYQIADFLNNPIDTSDTKVIWAEFFNKILANEKLSSFFHMVDKDTYLSEKEKIARINEYVNLNLSAYQMEKGALFAAVKYVVYKTKFVVVGNKDLSQTLKGLISIQAKNFENIEEDSRYVYIIDCNEIDSASIEKFEKLAVQKNLARLFLRETAKELQIGPMLYGDQFGCFKCDAGGDLAGEKVTHYSGLMKDLLYYEIIKVAPRLIECLMQDNTISKGKRFVLDKFDFSAYQLEHHFDINCSICSGK